jgi:hypothetical protein
MNDIDDMSDEKGSVDIWRDTPIRYLGYANEVGESFRPLMPALVIPSYVVAFGYVACDTVDKAMRAKRVSKPSCGCLCDLSLSLSLSLCCTYTHSLSCTGGRPCRRKLDEATDIHDGQQCRRYTHLANSGECTLSFLLVSFRVDTLTSVSCRRVSQFQATQSTAS